MKAKKPLTPRTIDALEAALKGKRAGDPYEVQTIPFTLRQSHAVVSANADFDKERPR
jgi:hypothetical protein